MLIPNHPHDERLSALASGDPEAVADSALSGHVASCHRCTDTVAELGVLRASLAEMPDLLPHRPLQLVPPVTDAPRGDRVGGWARRFFAPVLTAGAALAMVGLVGTTAALVPTPQSGADAAFIDEESQLQATDQRAAEEFSGAGAAPTEPQTLDTAGAGDGGGAEGPAVEPDEPQGETTRDADAGAFALSEERPIWPMLLFAGVALMIAAVLLRWILAPRAG